MRKDINDQSNAHKSYISLKHQNSTEDIQKEEYLFGNNESSSSLSDLSEYTENTKKKDVGNNIKKERALMIKTKNKNRRNIFYNEIKCNSSKNNDLMENNFYGKTKSPKILLPFRRMSIEEPTSEREENIELKIYYEGKSLFLQINKNDTLKNMFDKISKKLLPYYKLECYDIIYKLQIIDVIKYKNEKIGEIIKNDNDKEIPSLLLLKKKSDTNKLKGTTVKIENFPSFTDLSLELTKFFQKENMESNFSIDYSTNLCKILFNNSEKAISLVTFLSKLKEKNPIFKRLKVKLDYKLTINLKNIKSKPKELKLILPSINQKFISNIQKNNILFKDSINTPPKRRNDLKLIFPDIKSENKKSKVCLTIENERNIRPKLRNKIPEGKNFFSCMKLIKVTKPLDFIDLNEENSKNPHLNLLKLYNHNKKGSNREIFLNTNYGFGNYTSTKKIYEDKKIRKSFNKKGIRFPSFNLSVNKEKNSKKRESSDSRNINMLPKMEMETINYNNNIIDDSFIFAVKKYGRTPNRKSFIGVSNYNIFKEKNNNNQRDKKKLEVHFQSTKKKKKSKAIF